MTYELKNSTFEDRESLRKQFSVDLENLGDKYWNVSCEDEDADDVREFLELSAIEHRSV